MKTRYRVILFITALLSHFVSSAYVVSFDVMQPVGELSKKVILIGDYHWEGGPFEQRHGDLLCGLFNKLAASNKKTLVIYEMPDDQPALAFNDRIFSLGLVEKFAQSKEYKLGNCTFLRGDMRSLIFRSAYDPLMCINDPDVILPLLRQSENCKEIDKFEDISGLDSRFRRNVSYRDAFFDENGPFDALFEKLKNKMAPCSFKMFFDDQQQKLSTLFNFFVDHDHLINSVLFESFTWWVKNMLVVQNFIHQYLVTNTIKENYELLSEVKQKIEDVFADLTSRKARAWDTVFTNNQSQHENQMYTVIQECLKKQKSFDKQLNPLVNIIDIGSCIADIGFTYHLYKNLQEYDTIIVYVGLGHIKAVKNFLEGFTVLVNHNITGSLTNNPDIVKINKIEEELQHLETHLN